MVKDLIKRRDEVIKRAISFFKKEIETEKVPTIKALVEWMIEPHVKKDYEPYSFVEEKEVRTAFSKALEVVLEEKKDDKEKTD